MEPKSNQRICGISLPYHADRGNQGAFGRHAGRAGLRPVLWITFPMLKEAWGVMEAWGFTFKTVAFCLDQAEPEGEQPVYRHGVTGRGPMQNSACWRPRESKRQEKDVHQVILSHVEEHSKKPARPGGVLSG